MIDPDRWVRLALELHRRHTEDADDTELGLTAAERHAALDFAAVHDRFENPRGELSN